MERYWRRCKPCRVSTLNTARNRYSADQFPSIEEMEPLSTADLKRLFTQLNGAPAPAFASRGFLLGNIAWMLQVIANGNDPGKVRLELLKHANQASISSKTRYLPGTRLVREWHGVTHEVIIEESGYRWKNKRFRSLSRIAKEITGTHWSGPRFFGLKQS